MENLNIITLKNGVKVANFSSPHNFEFDDGTMLQAVSHDEADRLKIKFCEQESNQCGTTGECKDTRKFLNVELSFELTQAVREEIGDWLELYKKRDVDVVLVPLPMLTAMKSTYHELNDGFRNRRMWTMARIAKSPFRCIRIEDRNNRVISSRKFCI